MTPSEDVALAAKRLERATSYDIAVALNGGFGAQRKTDMLQDIVTVVRFVRLNTRDDLRRRLRSSLGDA